jgi:prepilin-type N-terminal cleavage/methylation domain-containing protein
VRHAFSLIEILVVIGIMALLIGILLPTLEHVRHRAYIADCASNLRQVGQYLSAYANDHRGHFRGPFTFRAHRCSAGPTPPRPIRSGPAGRCPMM